jgi:PAS domain S-box-containing protein
MRLSTRLAAAMVVLLLLMATVVGYLGYRGASPLVELAAVLAALVLAGLLARSRASPLAQMTRMEGFAPGEPSAMPTNPGGVIGRLAQAFARLAGELRDKTTTLEREIEQRHRTEERERLFCAAVESSGDAIVTNTLDGIITGWNPAAERLFGFAAEDAIGQNISIIVPDDRTAEVRSILERIGRGESVDHYETVRTSKDKRRIDVSLSVSPVKSSVGVIIGAAEIVRDITESNRGREALLDSERMSRGIIDTALDAFVQMDDSGIIIDWNPQAQAVFGWSRDEAIGKALHKLIVPERHRPHCQDGIARFLRSREGAVFGKRFEIEALRRDGNEIRVELSVTALSRRGGTVFNGFIRDMTEAVAAEERNRQSQKMEAVGQLIGGIAHDFNNMLTVITGTIDILADGVADKPRLASVAKLISQAADRGAELTGHLLAFARKQPLQPRETDINDLLVAVQGLLRPALGELIEIETVLEEDVWTALVDPTQLTTALINLADNARDAMPEGGKLTLETKNVVLDESDAGASREVPPGNYVMIAVSDTGTGIAEGIRERIFEPFFSTKAIGKATGLSMRMVHDFVKQSRGHINIYSEEGRGTTIKIYLPRSDAPAQQPPVAAFGSEIEGGSETILIVEDDALVRTYVTARLKNLGYRTPEARNAAEAKRSESEG